MKAKNNNPLFIPKGNGLGWTLNFYNKWSYLILVIIIALIVYGLYVSFIAK